LHLGGWHKGAGEIARERATQNNTEREIRKPATSTRASQATTPSQRAPEKAVGTTKDRRQRSQEKYGREREME